MKRRAIQVLFVAIGLAWMAFVFFDLFIHTYGDCGDVAFCTKYREVAGALVFWRGLCVATFIVIGYRIFRKDSDV